MAGNALANQTSPYLLQHKDNPVDWRPWGPDSLAEASGSNRPILLSIGYAACHWCHVMAHESFEDRAVAELINRHFVPVKVDREERPDLDSIYQQALALMGQHGGWPLTMFLTPAGEPFWGGTYFPPAARYGRPGFPEVLNAVAAAWESDPVKIRHNVAILKSSLEQSPASPGVEPLTLDQLDAGAREILALVDPSHGGLKGAPKFPQPSLFSFLWRTALRTSDAQLREAVTLTLDHIAYGGITDHLGGGFMRYATDETWLVPHFEKMLYDNAQLIDLFTLAWKGTRNPLYQSRVAEAVAWVLREMTAEGGAFAATLDADSAGGEGRFYTWTADEIDRALDPDMAHWFKQAYDVHPGGNWEGRTILHRNHSNQPAGIDDLLADARAVLWREREVRPRPARDDKVLADWNGMMIAALAHAGFVFDMPRWIDAARTAYETVRLGLSLPGQRLAHSMRFGQVNRVSLLDDYAQMARAALALHEATADPHLLDHTRAWVDAATLHHWDSDEGGFFQSADDAGDVIVRPKPVFDGATPSGNGIMAEVLARLWLATGESRHRDRAEATIAAFAGTVPDHVANMTSLLCAVELLAAPIQVVVVGPAESRDTESLLRAVAESPTATLSLSRQHNGSGHLSAGHPAHGKGMVEGASTAYVCRSFTCSPPIIDAGQLQDALSPG